MLVFTPQECHRFRLIDTVSATYMHVELYFILWIDQDRNNIYLIFILIQNIHMYEQSPYRYSGNRFQCWQNMWKVSCYEDKWHVVYNFFSSVFWYESLMMAITWNWTWVVVLFETYKPRIFFSVYCYSNPKSIINVLFYFKLVL